ncbi:DUF1844 domain-containing protein [bacterium]|nr:DUF1844 domain-containing protein [bacterium]
MTEKDKQKQQEKQNQQKQQDKQEQRDKQGSRNQQDQQKQKKKEEVIPPLDFSSLLLPFYTQALVKLDEIKNPEKDKHTLNLVKRLIDLLDLLKQRTQGNLKPQEEETLNNSIHHLKMAYMQKSKIIKS